jgi:hypothetical protein
MSLVTSAKVKGNGRVGCDRLSGGQMSGEVYSFRNGEKKLKIVNERREQSKEE